MPVRLSNPPGPPRHPIIGNLREICRDPLEFLLSAVRQYANFPFGGGPRLCIGRDFAMQEAMLILATVAQHYRLELAPSHPVAPEPLVTLRPKYGMKMILHCLARDGSG